MQDVAAQKAVFVTRKGYSNNARKKARRLGMSLFTLDDAQNRDWEFVKRIPVSVAELFAARFSPSFTMKPECKTTFSHGYQHFVNDRCLAKAFQQRLLNQDLSLIPNTDLKWDVREIPKPHFVRDVNGVEVMISDLTVGYRIEKRRYFGYLTYLPGTLSFKDVIDNKDTLLIDEDTLKDYRRHLLEYSNEDHFPTVPQVKLVSVVCSNFEMLPAQGRIKLVRPGKENHDVTRPS